MIFKKKLTDFDTSKSVLRSFLRSLRKSDLKTCIAALYSDFFGLTFFTWWPEMTFTCIIATKHRKWYLQMSETLMLIHWLCLRLTSKLCLPMSPSPKSRTFRLWPDLWRHQWPLGQNSQHVWNVHVPTRISNGVWILEIGPVVWEIMGGGDMPPPPNRMCDSPDPNGVRVNRAVISSFQGASKSVVALSAFLRVLMRRKPSKPALSRSPASKSPSRTEDVSYRTLNGRTTLNGVQSFLIIMYRINPGVWMWSNSFLLMVSGVPSIRAFRACPVPLALWRPSSLRIREAWLHLTQT